ncbi:MAG: YdeI/OmpD-associated family protein [Deltaproteobacteria bacterium]|nr:YdeI/OmpD-associated family protein [Deltaproteobacteria bacterium]
MKAPEARRAWETLSPSCQREYARWISEARREETRTARIQKALPLIQAKKRLKGWGGPGG